MNGRIKTRDKIECHFEIFGAIAIVFVEVRLKITGDEEERRDAIAQVIVECDGQASPYMQNLLLILSNPQLVTGTT